MSSRWYPPASKPIRVANGIKSRSTRGAIAQTWWSQRFIEVLEGFGLGTRLQRGRSYARQGQVLAIEVSPGQVAAEVQGSRARPYRVRIGTTAYGKSDWTRIEQLLVENAWYTASLLAGEMPEDIEDVFSSVGLPLFPASAKDLSLDCSCPDSAVPCKHLAAVFYLLAESFDDDPFAILAWRGRERDVLLANLQAARSNAPAADQAQASWRPLAECIDSFFAVQSEIRAVEPAPMSSAILLDQLPDTGVAVRGHSFVELLRPVYAELETESRGTE
ncbi:hypothetical protein MycrhDRAFT_3326 [Mycolicibacterium rhodesiae JS60]|nr:hypothetical protein MycrhDRAFT_3326 [Mycolicibacterium rhodesiae JS60]